MKGVGSGWGFLESRFVSSSNFSRLSKYDGTDFLPEEALWSSPSNKGFLLLFHEYLAYLLVGDIETSLDSRGEDNEIEEAEG